MRIIVIVSFLIILGPVFLQGAETTELVVVAASISADVKSDVEDSGGGSQLPVVRVIKHDEEDGGRSTYDSLKERLRFHDHMKSRCSEFDEQLLKDFWHMNKQVCALNLQRTFDQNKIKDLASSLAEESKRKDDYTAMCVRLAAARATAGVWKSAAKGSAVVIAGLLVGLVTTAVTCNS